MTQMRLIKGLLVFGFLVFLLVLLASSVRASGGFGCPGVDHRDYRCSCGNGQYEEYSNNEELKAAMARKTSCCYSGVKKAVIEKKVNTTTGWENMTADDYTTATWGFVNGKWTKLNITLNENVSNSTNSTEVVRPMENQILGGFVQMDPDAFSFMKYIIEILIG